MFHGILLVEWSCSGCPAWQIGVSIPPSDIIVLLSSLETFHDVADYVMLQGAVIGEDGILQTDLLILQEWNHVE